MNDFVKKLQSSMSMNVIGGLVGLILLFGFGVCIAGHRCFEGAFRNEYSTVTYHMADSATSYVNGDHIDSYLSGEEKEEYLKTKQELDTCCHKLNVSLIYVIKVDRSDYGRFVSVFNLVNNSVDNSNYTEWEIGYQHNSTNDEYRQTYRAIYDKEKEYGTVFRLNTDDGSHPHITTLVPVKDSQGEVTAILCMQRPVREMNDAIAPYLLLIFGQVFIMMILASAFAARFLNRSIILPVETVSKEAARFAEEKTAGQPLSGLSEYDVIRNLAGSIESMETDMLKYIDHMTAAAAERERISTELSIAAQIQNDALPDDFPAFPDRNEFDIYAVMDPALDVGGDYYNFFFRDDDHLVLVMADVSGKGIPASLFMMNTNIMILDRTQMGGSPAEILGFVNDNICKRNSADMFVTVWLGILEVSTGHLVYANAGHEYPAVYRKNDSFEIVKNKPGFVLGGMEGVRFRDYELKLEKGDKLFLYTDGVPEATDSQNRLYTISRMLDALNEHKEKSPREILEGVRENINEFVGDAPQFDDLTMLCFEMKEMTDDQAGES